MRARAIQFLTLALCVTLGGGAQACLCNGLDRSAAKKASSHACCTSDSAPTSPGRCHECELIAAAPKTLSLIAAPDLTVVPAWTIAVTQHVTIATHSHAHRPITPQLRDLYHLFAQLTE